MKRQAFQHPELRDANDNIIQQGTYGKESPLVNSDNTGVLDYINNNLEALYDNINGIQSTYAKKSDLSSSVSTTSLTVTGTTSVPTANAGNSSKAIANTEYVQGELTNYLPFSGGNITGNLTIGNKEVERVTTKSTNHIRYESGIQICWGELSIPAGTSGREVSGTMTFPYPFANTNYVLTFGNDWLSSSSEYYRAEGRNTGNFKFTAVGVNTNPHKAFYIAIGYWK